METEFPAACSVVYKELVVTFFNLTLLEAEPEEISQKLVYFIRDSMLKAGYSRAMKGHMNLRRQYHQAYTALSLGSQIKPQLWIHHFNQVAVPYIFRQATRILPGHMLCYEHLLDLIRMDEEQHTEYLKTLRVYLEHNLNTVQSAKAPLHPQKHLPLPHGKNPYYPGNRPGRPGPVILSESLPSSSGHRRKSPVHRIDTPPKTLPPALHYPCAGGNFKLIIFSLHFLFISNLHKIHFLLL